ncbi:MAG TPA: DUF6088 family protein [Bacteroidales bacterium]|jgi:hypothetical protein|nr:DUF6088 family protein [Bacteroidales bacterium]
MNLYKQIDQQIRKLSEGRVFGYSDLDIDRKDYLSAAKALERMKNKGLINKISNGEFYKPIKTAFGELKPDYKEQLRPFLFENGKRIAYVTGTYLYNQLGLTTQLAVRIKIASRSKRISINRGALKADAVKSYAEVTDSNYTFLGFLDAFKDIRQIPDTTVQNTIKILSARIAKMNDKEVAQLIKYALLYPPRVRALLGAILESLGKPQDITTPLLKSINPLTKINLGLTKSDLPTIDNWNIV